MYIFDVLMEEVHILSLDGTAFRMAEPNPATLL